MWISRKRFDALEKRLADLETKVQGQPKGQSYHVVDLPPNQWRRFEPLTDDPEELQKLEELLNEKQLNRQDLARILFSLRVRPGFQRADFGI